LLLINGYARAWYYKDINNYIFDTPSGSTAVLWRMAIGITWPSW
jgi:hypothetical protein